MISVMFGASSEEISNLRESGNLDPDSHGLDTVDLGKISPYALVTLDSVVTGASVEELDVVLDDLLDSADDGEQLLFTVRTEFLPALQTRGPADVTTAGAAWAATEEMQADRWTAESATSVISELVALSLRLDPSRNLYTWLCV